MNNQTKKIVGIGLFTAIVVVLQLLGGGIRFGTMFSITLVLVPIVVGAAVYGWQAGAWLGLAFGVAVLLSGDAGPFLSVNPMGAVSVVLIKGILCGLLSGIVYALTEHINSTIAVVLAALTCPIVNTGVFLIGCNLFFYDTLVEWAAVYGFPSAANYMILGLAGINFLIELAVNIALAPTIVRLIYIGKK